MDRQFSTLIHPDGHTVTETAAASLKPKLTDKLKSTCQKLLACPLLSMLLLATLLLTTGQLAIAAEPVSKSRLRGIAIGGHDTVAYYTLNANPHEQAKPGKKSHVVKWKGAKWRFASAEAANSFRSEPEKYSPAFNGHCANALSLGKGLLKTDGTHWEIFGDKLYLFYAAAGRDRWMAVADVKPYIEAAELEWDKLK